MPDTPPRIVLDTNAWLDLLVFADPRIGTLASALRQGGVVAVTDSACREEWRRVLDYPVLALPTVRQHALMDAYDVHAVLVEASASPDGVLPRCSDPDDQKFLELAHASGARWLLSRDKALLKLNRRTRRDGLFEILVPEAWTPPG